MKIAIISINMYTSGLSFASILHSYAFQQFMAAHGFETTILDYTPLYFNDFDLEHPYKTYKKRGRELAQQLSCITDEEQRILMQQKIEANDKITAIWEAISREREIRYKKITEFVKNRYMKTDLHYNSDLLEVMDPGFDCYICVTDVIWKNERGTGFDRGFFLASTAMENKWKIAYSAGRGPRGAKTKAEKRLFFHYLRDLDYISVRETSLKDYIEKNSELKAQHVLDPVLLNDASFYEEMSIQPQEQHYVLLYYVMGTAEDTVWQAVNYAQKHHLTIIEITDQPLIEGNSKCPGINSILKYEIGVEEWLGYIRNAECIFTNSFHCACLSILFEKNFYTGTRKSDKVACLMHYFGLQHRMINMETDLENDGIPDINWSDVRKRLADGRAQSEHFILSAVHDIEGKCREPRDYKKFKKKQKYKISYYAVAKNSNKVSSNYTEEQGTVKKKNDDTWVYQSSAEMRNNGKSILQNNQFYMEHYKFSGWRLRLQIDRMWFWILEDGSLKAVHAYDTNRDGNIKIFKEEQKIPYVPVNQIKEMIAEVVWEEDLTALMKIRRRIFH